MVGRERGGKTQLIWDFCVYWRKVLPDWHGEGRFFDNLSDCEAGCGKRSSQRDDPTFWKPHGGDFTRQEKRIRGNTRTLRRQYAARNWTFVRVLPGIAGYCRVVGPGENSETSTNSVESLGRADQRGRSTIKRSPKRAFSRAALRCALRIARRALVTKDDCERRDLMGGFDLLLDVVIKFGFDQQCGRALPPGD